MKHLVFILFVAVAVSLSAQDRNVKHDYGTNTVSVPDTYLYLPQDAYSKTAPPGVTNDVTEGFYVGSVWHDTTNLKAYICLANATNNAQWKEVTSVASGYVDTAGTPANDQIAVFVDADTVEGNSAFTFDGSTMTLGADFHVNSNGNIGINTTTPTADIDIAENETNFGSINFTHGGAGGHGGKISIYHTGLTQQYQGVIELVDDGSYNADLIYSAKDAGTVGAPLEEKFRFDSSGNVFDITGSLTSSVDLQAPTLTLDDATHSVRLALDGDRIFHDTDDDGIKDAGEEYIDHGAGGSGNVSNTGTPVDGQIAIFTDATTVEGDPAFTFDTTDDTLDLGSGGNIDINGVRVIDGGSVSATLNAISAIDSTTEMAIESALDSLTNLVTVGTIGTGTWQASTIADAYIASAATWTAKQDQGDILDDLNDMLATASAADQIIVSTGVGTFQLETGNTARASLGLAIGTDVQAHSAVLDATTASFLVADENKLDGIEAGATADQTGAEIKTAYESQANTNAFTDAEKTKLSGIETGATADQTAADIRALGFFDTSNDGASSGLDADLLDGQQASAFAAASHTHDLSTDVTGQLPYANVGHVTFQVAVGASGTALAVGDDQGNLVIPAWMGTGTWNLTAVHASVGTAGTTGASTIQIRNVSDSADMLSTKINIDSGQTGSDTSGTAAVIDTTNDDVINFKRLAIDIDSVSTTPPNGVLIVTLEFTRQ